MPDAARMTCFARALRSNATDAERVLWTILASARPRFTRQLAIGPFIADFACRRARLIVELDGGQHADNPRDRARTLALESDGWRVLRFWNPDVFTNVDGVVEAIFEAAAPRLPPGETFSFAKSRPSRHRKEPPPTPPRIRGGE